MSQLTSSRALLLLLAVTGCDRAPEVTGPAATSALRAVVASQEDPIGPGVLEAIARDGSARIVVSLKDEDMPDVSRGRSGEEHARSLTARRDAVSTAQDEALADIPNEELAVHRRFAAVPAVAAEANSEAAVRKLAAKGRVRRIDLDVGGEGDLATSVALIGADQRYAAGNDGEGTVVAIIDTGIDTDHPDLADDVLQQACFGFRPTASGGPFCANGTTRQTGPGAAEDLSGHGTHVSGIVTSAGAQASRGVAPGAGIVALRVMDNCSFAGCFYAFSEIVAALDYIIQNNATLGVQVINMSLGTGQRFAGICDNSTAFTQAGAAAVNTLRNMGVIAFASAGNNNSTTMGAPACLSNVVSVGAANNLDVAASFTNSNATTDLFAPGVSIRSSLRNGGTILASGTSMASPHAAGCAALLIQTGYTTPAAIEARLKASAFTVTRNAISFPRVDCSPNRAPLAAAGGPYAGTEGTAITVSGSATDADGDALTYSWSFGDGSPDESGPASTHATRSHTYVDNCTSGCADGAYVVTLTVGDGHGGTDTRTTSAMIANAPPQVSVAGDQSIVSGGTFTGLGGSFVDAGLADGVWNWTVSWGAGQGATSGSASAPGAITATRQYLTAGTYTVTLSVTDKDGATDSRSLQLTVHHIVVGIDVKPGGDDVTPISLNGAADARIPVAVLSTPAFDAPALVDVATVTLGDGASPGAPVALRMNDTRMVGVEDVNGDGRLDLVLHFERNALMASGLTASTTTLRLLATLTDGRQVMGSEAVRIVPDSSDPRAPLVP